jgi:hypothetical protein
MHSFSSFIVSCVGPYLCAVMNVYCVGQLCVVIPDVTLVFMVHYLEISVCLTDIPLITYVACYAVYALRFVCVVWFFGKWNRT